METNETSVPQMPPTTPPPPPPPSPNTSSAATLAPAGQILKQSFDIFKQRYVTLIGILAVPTVIGMLPALFVGPKPHAPTFTLSSNMGIFIFVWVIATVIAYLWSACAVLVNLKNTSQDIGFSQSYTEGKKYILSFLGVSLLVGLATLGGFILLIIPGIIFTVWFSQSQYILFDQNISGTEALKASKQLVQGRFGSVIWRWFFIVLVLLIVTMVANFIAGIISMGNPTIAVILSNLVSLIVSPVAVIYGFELYRALKNTKTA